jgi:hypothetical protein
MSNWIKIASKLPPSNTLIWVKRIPNTVDNTPIYLAMRKDLPLATNPDASRDCFWYGGHISTVLSQENANAIKFSSSFSDVTVLEWCYIEIPAI